MRYALSAVALFLILVLSVPAAEPAGALLSREEVPLPGGPWLAPVPSPDGRHLAFTAEGHRGLKLLDLESFRVLSLSESAGAGFRPSWSEDATSLAFRTSSGGPRPLLRIVVGHPDGTTETASASVRSLSVPAWRGDTLTFATFAGEVPEPSRAGPESSPELPGAPVASPDGRLWFPEADGRLRPGSADGRVYFLPVASPDGTLFVTECLDGHLYLGRVSGGPIEDLGPGSYPSFVRGGKALLFERTADDGHRVTASDLHLVDLGTREVVAVTATPERVERRPRMAGDGHTLYFEEGGRIFRGWLP